MSNTQNPNIHCSFCGKSQDDVKKMIAGSDVYICNECIELSTRILEEELKEEQDSEMLEVKTPKEMFDHLNEYVIGQEKANVRLQLRFIIIIKELILQQVKLLKILSFKNQISYSLAQQVQERLSLHRL